MTRPQLPLALAALGLAGALALTGCSSPEINNTPAANAAPLGDCPADLADYVATLFPGASVTPHTVTQFSLDAGSRLPSPSCAFDITMKSNTSDASAPAADSAATLLYGFYITDSGTTYTSITDVLKANDYSLVSGSTTWQAVGESGEPGPIVNVETTDAEGAQSDETPINDAYILVTIFGTDSGSAPAE